MRSTPVVVLLFAGLINLTRPGPAPASETQAPEPAAQVRRAGDPAQALPERQLVMKRRWPWLGTLITGGAVMMVGGTLGGLALWQARDFQRMVDDGAPRPELLSTRFSAQALALSCDALLGTGAILVLSAVIMRFGTRRVDPVLEAPYELPPR